MLRIEDLHKTYGLRNGSGGATALRGVSLEVSEGEFFTLLGPSGCGKTTTLQCVAGLETPDTGRIELGGRAVYCSRDRIAVPANQRNLGMVFQSYAIWPHMTVFENVAFPLVHAGRKVSGSDVRRRVMEALARVRLGHLADRAAPLLSGGQQQRVALARALVHEPAILLLDEPLSNLDAKLRDSMRSELRQLVKSLGITTVLVTHDQVEALGMSDAVALMRDGRIVQKAPPREIYLEPRNAFAADFMGRSNILPAKVQEAGELTRVSTALGPLIGRQLQPLEGAPTVAVIRPQAIVLHPVAAGAGGINRFRGRVTAVQFLGDVVEAEIAIGEAQLKLLLDPYTALRAGDEAVFEIPPDRCVIVPADLESTGHGEPT